MPLPCVRLSKNHVIASQCAHYSALRAAFGGCAMYAACGLVRADI